MKKTRADISSSLDHGRNPGCVAAWRDWFQLSETGAKMQHDAGKLGWTFRDETSSEIAGMLVDQALNLLLQFFYLDAVEGNLFVTLR